jgi:hypothetical protein
MYSLHAQHFVKSAVSSFWNININFSYKNFSQKQCIERQICCMKSGIKTQQAFYWENFNLGDILWGMPGTANCIARLVNKSGIHTTDKIVTDQGQITLSKETLYLQEALQLWYGIN